MQADLFIVQPAIRKEKRTNKRYLLSTPLFLFSLDAALKNNEVLCPLDKHYKKEF